MIRKRSIANYYFIIEIIVKITVNLDFKIFKSIRPILLYPKNITYINIPAFTRNGGNREVEFLASSTQETFHRSFYTPISSTSL